MDNKTVTEHINEELPDAGVYFFYPIIIKGKLCGASFVSNREVSSIYWRMLVRKKLEKKLLSLFLGELVAVCMFLFLWFQFIDKYGVVFTKPANLFGFVLLEFILLQGSYYWWIKYRSARSGLTKGLGTNHVRLFKALKVFNIGLLIVGLMVMGLQWQQMNGTFYLYLFLYCFALVEYINYFHIRLSYMYAGEFKELWRKKRLSRSVLARDLREGGNLR